MIVASSFVLIPEPGGGGPPIVLLTNEQEMIVKTQFQSTEALAIRLRPFVDKTTGDYIVGGTDVVTLAIRKPDGTALAGGPHLATYDANVDLWYFNIVTGSYAQGEWRIKATTDDANGLPQWLSLRWGDYVDDLTTIKSHTTDIKKMTLNRWKIEANQLKVYQDDGTTLWKTFNLFDSLGGATSIRAFERVPV